MVAHTRSLELTGLLRNRQVRVGVVCIESKPSLVDFIRVGHVVFSNQDCFGF